MVSTQYRVYVTLKTDVHTYGDEIEITDYVTFDGIGLIRSQIDAQDYNVGVFNYDDLEMKVHNVNGLFNEETDLRSLFKFTRDQAKIRIVFSNDNGDYIVFRGLINEEATKLDTQKELITFKVLSRDSVIRNVQVAAGLVSDGMTAKNAILAIMNQSAIGAVLTTISANVNPDLDFHIDDGSKFDSISCKDAINNLLVASNSIMLIDDLGNVTIKDRTEDTTRDIVNLFGPYDIYRRQNTIKMTDYNTGKQRMYNSFRVNDQFASNAGFAIQFGFRQYEVDLNFVTSDNTAAEIAANLLDEFKYPKLETQVMIPISVAPGIKLLDRVSLNWPLLVKPWPGTFFPVIGITKIGDDMEPLPIRLGSIDVQPTVAWKVILIEENPKDFTKNLKLRQIGKNISDGYFNIEGSALVGFAIIGIAKIRGTGTISYNPSVVGAAVINNTKIS
jgi:hypothetical protein